MRRPVRQTSISRLRGFQRWAMLLVLAFAAGLVAQSVLGAVGEAREIAGHAVPHPHDALDAGDLDHVIAHHVHCCAHAGMLTGEEPPSVAFAFVGARPPAGTSAPVAGSRLSSPFRPPIPA